MARSGYTEENDKRLAAYLHGLSDAEIEELQLSILHSLNVNESTRAALVHQAAMLRREKVARGRQTLNSSQHVTSGNSLETSE